TVALHALYFYGLARSYGSGAYSAVYPVARGLGVALVPVIAFAALDERVSSVGALGIGLVAGGIVAVQFATGAPPSALAAGLGWAAATSVVIAGYSLVDKAGVARIHPVPYIALISGAEPRTRIPGSSRGPDAQDAKLQRKRSVSGSSFWRCLGSPCRSWCRSGDSNPDTLAGTRP